MSSNRIHIKKDDQVKVLAGKDVGKTGKVLYVFPEEGRAIVEGINITKRHQRPTQQMQQGGILEKEAAIDASNLMLICPSCNEPSRTGRMKLENGEKVRVCKKCEEIIED